MRTGLHRGRHLLVVAAVILAGGAAAADSPVVHEYVRIRHAAPAAVVGQPREGQNPQAIRRGDRLLPAPADPARPTAGEETLKPAGRSPTALDRATAFAPDRVTGPESELKYHGVFNPSVLPFKRGQALDLVRADGSLGVADHTLRPVPVGGTPREGGELFFGSVMVELGNGPVAIPSVAPDVRVLSYETEPRVPVKFLRDGADNYFVQARRGAVVRARLKWLSEAPSTYFSGQVADTAHLDDVPSTWLRPVPAAYRQRAARVAARIGVDREAPLRAVLDRLVGWFRAFAPGTLPPVRGDLYLDLALAQKGVCRHRAYAFMITANALGLPTRMVHNEAHAFVEVRLPEVGWRRVDLGGAADLLQVSGAGDKVVHRPRAPDPFPQPRSYRDGATRVAGASAIRGLRDDQLRDLRSPSEGGHGPSGATGATGRAAPPRGRLGPSGEPLPGRPPGSPPEGPEPPAPDVVPAAPTIIRLSRYSTSGFRGEPLEVSGRVAAARHGASGLRVEIQLRPLAGGRSRTLGTLTTDIAGRFGGKVVLPVDLELGDYRLVLEAVGDERRQGSSTE